MTDFMIVLLFFFSMCTCVDWYRTGNIYGLGPKWLRYPVILVSGMAAIITTALMCAMVTKFSVTYENNGMTIRYEQLFGRTPTK